jgi:NAD(P)-dependent dehydrogenase (short-subunit alcohol dehydrogenase family)
MNVMIVGAAGGIGSAVLEHYLNHPNVGRVYATHHRPVSSTVENLQWLQLDMADGDSIATAMAAVDVPIDRWICCTGLLAGTYGQPEKTYRQLDHTKLQHDYAVNAVGPLSAFAQLAKQLRSDGMKAVFLSAQVGSITDNGLGGWYGYRMSKAALNMGVRCLAIECARWRSSPTIVAVHPGTTVSNLSRPFTQSRTAPMQTTAQCAQALYELVEFLGPSQSGRFLKLDGQELPW